MLELILLAYWQLSTETPQLSTPPNTSGDLAMIQPAPVPYKETSSEPKLLDQQSVAVYAQDLASSKTLIEKRSNRPQAIASLTKIMTFLVIWEDLKLDTVVSVPLEATQIQGAQIDLFQYEKLTVETLLRAILIPSANDAAVALAIHHSGSEEAFAKVMNQKAKEIGLRSATFYNATGLDLINIEEGTAYGNQMSAYEVALMTKHALKIPFFRETVAQSEFFGTSIDERFAHNKASTNQLLGSFLGSQGVKTGYTELAGQCLVHLSRRDDGVEILSVVLGSPDRFQETKNILTWVWDHFVWQ